MPLSGKAGIFELRVLIWVGKAIDLAILGEGVVGNRVVEQKNDAPAQYQENEQAAKNSVREHVLNPAECTILFHRGLGSFDFDIEDLSFRHGGWHGAQAKVSSSASIRNTEIRVRRIIQSKC